MEEKTKMDGRVGATPGDKPARVGATLPGVDWSLGGTPRLAGVETDPEGRPVAQKPMSYTELFQKFNPHKPETEEDRIKRERKEKRQKGFAAIADGISALANIYFASRGARNMFDASKGLSAKTNERIERLRKEREANEKAWYEGYVRARAMDEQKEQGDRTWRHTLEREKIADERYEQAQKQQQDQLRMQREMARLDQELKRNQITASEYKTEQERIKAAYAPLQQQAELSYKGAGIRQRTAAAGASDAAAEASRAKADNYRNGGSGGKGPTLNLEDGTHHYGNVPDYQRAVERKAKEYGVETKDVEVLERDLKGNVKKQRTVKRDVSRVAADVEEEAASRRQATLQPQPGPKGSQSPGNGAGSTQGSAGGAQENTGAQGNRWSKTSNIKW